MVDGEKKRVTAGRGEPGWIGGDRNNSIADSCI